MTIRSLSQCAVGAEHAVEVVDQGVEPGVDGAVVAAAPLAEPFEVLDVVVGESGSARLLLCEGQHLGLVDQALFQVVGVDAEDLVVVAVEVDGRRPSVRVSR